MTLSILFFILYREMLKRGFRDPWPVALEVLTGSRKMDIGSVIKFFQPLMDYFDKELEAAGETPGFTLE